MSEPHRIRIRGPWTFVAADGESGTVKLPAVWEHRTTDVRFSRKFNWLAELDESETVFLVFAGYGGKGEVSLHDNKLGDLTGEPVSFAITNLLQPSNPMEVSLSFTDLAEDTPAGLWGDVFIEVRRGPASPGAGGDDG